MPGCRHPECRSCSFPTEPLSWPEHFPEVWEHWVPWVLLGQQEPLLRATADPGVPTERVPAVAKARSATAAVTVIAAMLAVREAGLVVWEAEVQEVIR